MLQRQWCGQWLGTESSTQNQWLWSPHVQAPTSPCWPLLAPCLQRAPEKLPPKYPSVCPSNLPTASPSTLLSEVWAIYHHSVSFPNNYWMCQWTAVMVATLNQVLSPFFDPGYFDSSFLAIFPALVSSLGACCSLIHLMHSFLFLCALILFIISHWQSSLYELQWTVKDVTRNYGFSWWNGKAEGME